MKKILFLLLFFPSILFADDCGLFGCLFSPGTICINGVCVPSVTIQPTPLISTIPVSDKNIVKVSISNIIQEVNCPEDFKLLQVYLLLPNPLPIGTEFSSAIMYEKSLFFAAKDIFGNLVFIQWPNSKYEISSVAYLIQWRNYALESFLSTQTCASIKGLTFAMGYGVSTATFKFK